MSKEVLDAVNLQSQYRTFVEVRDCMLQQARQRADVFVIDVCPATKNIVTTASLSSTSTDNPTATKNTPVPMDVSQMSSNVRIRIVTETTCSLSRAKVTAASREPVSNVE